MARRRNQRSVRAARLERATSVAKPDLDARKTPGRDTFKVAKALRAPELSGLIYQASQKKAVPQKKAPTPVDYGNGPQTPAVAKRRQAQTSEGQKERNLSLVEKRCKTRPSKTSGNGNSRPFVPWCK